MTWVVQWLRLVLSKGPNRVGVSSPQLRAETNSVSETLYVQVIIIQDDGQSPETTVILRILLVEVGGTYRINGL
jgi:hypothetical protein